MAMDGHLTENLKEIIDLNISIEKKSCLIIYLKKKNVRSVKNKF